MRVTIELFSDAAEVGGNQSKRIAVSELPVIGPILRGRWFQWAMTVVTLAVFLVVILSGLFGTPAGNHNFGIIYVWLVWWAVLKLVLIPFLGRFWCAICPFATINDLVQKFVGNNRPVPKFLKKYEDLATRIRDAVGAYGREVREGAFPDDAHSFSCD
mgnify:CR=1 FL=1